jgi:hypothetical protein
MMMPLMQKMAAPLLLASALCHVATVVVMMNMHVQLSTVQDTATGPHRSLLESTNADALVSVRAQLESMRDEMEEMRADKLRSDERVELLSSQVDKLAEELRATRKGEQTQGPEAEAEQGLNTTHRQMQQGAAGSCDASGVCTARIITRTVVMQSAMSSGGGPPQRGRRAQSAPCDFAAESAAVMDVCCATAGGGKHRRAQADCPLPDVCPSARCAQVFQAFYSSCRAELEASPELGAGLAALPASCTELLGGSSLARQLNLRSFPV